MSDFESQEPRDFQQDNPRKRQNVAKRALIYGFKNPNGYPKYTANLGAIKGGLGLLKEAELSVL